MRSSATRISAPATPVRPTRGVDPNFGAGQGGGFGGGFGGFDMGDIDLGDIFGSFFGGGFGGGSSSRRSGPMKGETLRASVTIRFEEAAFGCEKELSPHPAARSATSATAAAAPRAPRQRSAPTATVRVPSRIQRGGGAFSFATTTQCPKCGGTGKDHPQPLPQLRRLRVGAPPAEDHRQDPCGHRQRPGHLPAGDRAARARTAVPPAT